MLINIDIIELAGKHRLPDNPFPDTPMGTYVPVGILAVPRSDTYRCVQFVIKLLRRNTISYRSHAHQCHIYVTYQIYFILFKLNNNRNTRCTRIGVIMLSC